MTTIYKATDLRSIGLGAVATKTDTLTNATASLFTIAGGLVAVSFIVGRATVAITVANTYKLQHNPTAGTTKDLCASADIGTTDTVLGEVFVITGLSTDAIALGSKGVKAPYTLLETGDIERVSSGTDGEIKWYVGWVPVDDGATLVAA